MNITEKVREQILINENDFPEDKKAFLCALVKCLGSIEIENGKTYLGLESRHRDAIVAALTLIKELCDVEVEFGGAEGKGYYVRAEGKAAAKVLSFATGGRSLTDLGETDSIKSRLEAAAYARGAFLASGSAYIPSDKIQEKSAGYHVEFLFFGEDAATEFHKLLSRCALSAQVSKKGNYYSVYAKSAEAVSDVLAFMGASESVMQIADVSVTREMNNAANRKANCGVANMEKSVGTAMRQVEAIEKLKASGEYANLDDKLKETCEARSKYPDATLGELAKLMGISKSGLNHRLARITELGERN